MLWQAVSAARDIGRLHEVAVVLMRYGFGDLLRRMGMLGTLEKAGRVVPLGHLEALVRLPPAERVRRAMEELGPCFVKLGQIFASRVDLFAPDWIAEFEKLQNQVPPVPFADIRARIADALGADPDGVFAELDPEPLAAASIAQVHRARLGDGRAVVVKVRRPGLRALVEADMRLLQHLAAIVESEAPELGRYQPVALVRQLQRSLRRELDLAAECRHAERIRTNLQNFSGIVVPGVHWPYTNERMNVQDFIDGVALTDGDALTQAGCDRPAIARLGAQAVLAMMLEHGFFHADPHAGNVFWLPGDRLALIDFGMVGRLSSHRRAQLVELLQALVERDTEAAVAVLLEWADDSAADTEALAEDVDAFIDTYHGVPLGQLRLGTMLAEVAALVRSHRLRLPADLALVIKVFITLEGMGHRLDPDFDMAGEAQPFLRRAMLARYAPRTILRQGWRAMGDALVLLGGMPREFRKLLQTVRQGRFNLHVELERLKRFGEQVEHSANRLTIGIVIAALIIGSSIVMTVSGGPTLLGLPVFGLLGFVAAVLGSLWLLYSIWRSGGGR